MQAAVVAYLDLQPTHPVRLPVAGHTETDASGFYSLDVAPTASIQRYGRSRGGYVNFIVFVVAADGRTSWHEVIRRLSLDAGHWTGFPGVDTAWVTTTIAGAGGFRVDLAPDAPTPPCLKKAPYGSPWVSWNRVNEEHTASHTSGYVKYGLGYTQSMGIMAGITHTTGWEAAGQMSVSKSGNSTVTDGDVVDHEDRWIRAKTNEQEYAVVCVGNRVEPKGWAGDIDYHGSKADDVNCQDVFDGNRVKYFPGHVQTKTQGTANSEGYSLTAAPVPRMLSVGLSATMTYGTTIEQQWVASRGDHWLCGNGTSFTNAGVVFAHDV